MSYNEHTKRKRTHNGFTIKVRFKVFYLAFFIFCIGCVDCNRPPRFLIDGQTEIVLRLREGDDTPVGTLIYELRGVDPDGDKLEFGVKPQSGSNVIRVESVSPTEANVYLNQELDRETRDEYALVLTLTDGRLGLGNYVTQSFLLLVEDVNDNTPIFNHYQPSVSIKEDAPPGIIASLEATDEDEGPYGQVIYHLQEVGADKHLFAISTIAGKAIIKLIGSLDYEKQILHQIKVLAVDRAKQGRVNTGTASILVKVQDVEDQPPEFVKIQPVARINEDAPVGTSVLQVTAVDGDRGINNPVQYAISASNVDNDVDLFTVEKHTGIVRTTKILDRELMSPFSGAYIIQITATEIGSRILPPPSVTTEITVIVTDINDQTPTFKSNHYICEVGENAPPNTPLSFMQKSDPEVYDFDQGINGTFELFVLGANETFEVTPSRAINEASFLIRVKNSSLLDYEQRNLLNFTLVARETATSERRSSAVPVIVHILDRNDNYPEFTKKVYEVTVAENCEVGTTIAWVQAVDDDHGKFGTEGIRYTNLTGSIGNLLDLNPLSGIIKVKSAGGPNWDRELISRHYLTVEARDDLGNGNRNSVQLIINLDDVNDNPPVFTQSHYEVRLMENKADFETVLKIEARDADLNGTKNSDVEYSLYGEFKKNFSVDSMTGIIKPRYPVDFEKIESNGASTNTRTINLKVRARDWGTPSLYTDAPLTIYVQDVNDHPPSFEKDLYKTTVPENLPSESSVLKVNAFDLDGSAPNNRIVYRIQSGASDKFVIDPESGVISVARGASLDPDLSTPRKLHYSLVVLAIDGASGESQMHASVSVNITVVDINNKNPVISAPHSITVRENTPVGTVITRIAANDLDTTADLKFKLDKDVCEAKSERGILVKQADFDCSSAFELGDDGVLIIAKSIDREIVELFNIGVIVEDVASNTGPQIAQATIHIQVEDVNDNNPKFNRPFYRYSVPENSKTGLHIGAVTANDADKNKTVIYSMEGMPEIVKMVYLDRESGDITVASKIDHESYNWLNLTVKATDTGIPRRSARVELFIQVLDENDNSPYFLLEPYSAMVPEDASLGQSVSYVEARDPDSGEYGKVTYLLDRLSSEGKFSVDPETGIIRIAEKLDRETKRSYLLVIEAWDNYQYGYNNGESRNAFKHLNVTVLDVNDNAPEFLIPTGCVSITEFHEPSNLITTILTSDADDPTTPNGQVIIDISNSNELDDLFTVTQINEHTAEVHAARTLHGKHGNYTLLLRMQDLGTPSHLVEAPLDICITDYNDHAPIFISPPPNSTLRVPENATVGSALVQIIATDADVGANGAIRYRLKVDPAEHYKTFEIQPVSGILELRLPLSRKKQKVYVIRIEAFDLGEPTSLSSDLDLTVYVSSVNDYQPQFLIDELFVNFTENASPGKETIKLPDTIDRDEFELEGPLQPVCYYIIGGNEDGMFKLGKQTHVLSVKTALDREKRNAYTLLVKATEDCLKSPKSQIFYDSSDDTQLKVVVNVTDVNDNAPKFIRRVFTGGVSTATSFGTKFMNAKAIDADLGVNAEVSYYLIGRIKMTLTEGLDNIHRPPFLVERETGAVLLNFDPQYGMKGYFDFMIVANDTGGLQDMARVFIYLLREDQRVRFILRQQVAELRDKIEVFREVLGNVTGAIVNVDEFRVHANYDGTVDKTRTDLYLHLVDQRDNSILEVPDVLRLIDQNTEKLDALFKEFNVLDTQPGGSLALSSLQNTEATFWLMAFSMFLLLLLLLCMALCINQRQTYQRKLKAATATAYDIDSRGLSQLSGRVPNTNKHSVEGSNPIWLQAYENEWYKNADDFSHSGSENDSLDENVVSFEQCESLEPQNDLNRIQNIYQTLAPAPLPLPRKLETTEL